MPSKPQLRLGFIDYYNPVDEFFTDWLSDTYEVVRDDWNPKYVIFCDETFGQSNSRFDDNPDVVKIFYTGENRRPWKYKAHHAISFDHLESPQYYRLPLYVMDNWLQMNKMGLPSAILGSLNKHTVDHKSEGFCSFVVANGGCAERNNIFHKLSEYKKVDSGGPLFNNIGCVLPRDGTNAQKTKFAFIEKRKFNICYENSCYPGYATEKLFHALYLNTVPIYWGSPTVGEDFNMDAVINRHYFNSDDEMIERIKWIDQNDEEYNRMLEYGHEKILNGYSQVFSRSRFNRWFHENVYKG